MHGKMIARTKFNAEDAKEQRAANKNRPRTNADLTD
jgi:hypothetical protein